MNRIFLLFIFFLAFTVDIFAASSPLYFHRYQLEKNPAGLYFIGYNPNGSENWVTLADIDLNKLTSQQALDIMIRFYERDFYYNLMGDSETPIAEIRSKLKDLFPGQKTFLDMIKPFFQFEEEGKNKSFFLSMEKRSDTAFVSAISFYPYVGGDSYKKVSFHRIMNAYLNLKLWSLFQNPQFFNAMSSTDVSTLLIETQLQFIKDFSHLFYSAKEEGLLPDGSHSTSGIDSRLKLFKSFGIFSFGGGITDEQVIFLHKHQLIGNFVPVIKKLIDPYGSLNYEIPNFFDRNGGFDSNCLEVFMNYANTSIKIEDSEIKIFVENPVRDNEQNIKILEKLGISLPVNSDSRPPMTIFPIFFDWIKIAFKLANIAPQRMNNHQNDSFFKLGENFPDSYYVQKYLKLPGNTNILETVNENAVLSAMLMFILDAKSQNNSEIDFSKFASSRFAVGIAGFASIEGIEKVDFVYFGEVLKALYESMDPISKMVGPTLAVGGTCGWNNVPLLE